MIKENILFIRAKEPHDYYFDAIESMGYRILIPYKDRNLLLRLLREVWYRLHLPFRSVWYNKKIASEKAEIVIIEDPLITPDFVEWVRKVHPNSRVVLQYENRANKTICPDMVTNPTIEKWSYDSDDCEKYGMLYKSGGYLDIYKIQKSNQSEYDILYLGRDKGRSELLFELQHTCNEMGITTYFHICADRKFLRFKKKYYKPVLQYCEYLDLLSRSKAILNLVPDGQTSLTMREYEAVFNGIKCITNNRGVLNFDLYDRSIYFLLGVDDINSLKCFLDTPCKKIPANKLEPYTFQNVLNRNIER